MQILLNRSIIQTVSHINYVRVIPILNNSLIRSFTDSVQPILTDKESKSTEAVPLKTETVASNIQDKPKGSVLNFHRTWVQKVDENGKVYYQNEKTLEIVHELDSLVPTASRGKRICAGLIDLAFASLCGMGVYYLAALEMGDQNIGLVICSMYTSLTFLLRDSLFENKTRSLGKRLMKLEIVTKEGKISGPIRNAFRNIYALPIAMQSFLPPPFMAPFSLFLMCDFVSFLAVKRRLLEYPLGTRVIDEQPDRANRLKVYKEDNDEKDRKESLESSGMLNAIAASSDNPNKSTMAKYM